MINSKYWLGFISNEEYQYEFAVMEGYIKTTLLPQPDHPTDPAIGGRIIIDNYIRDFWCSTRLWKEKDYYQHWQESLSRLVVEGAENTAVLTSLHPYTGQDTWEDVHFWTLVRDGQMVKCMKHNTTQLSYYMIHGKPLEPRGLYEMVTTDDTYRNNDRVYGTITLDSIAVFLNELKTRNQVGEEPDDGKLSSPVLKPSRRGDSPA